MQFQSIIKTYVYSLFFFVKNNNITVRNVTKVFRYVRS